jgi:adenylate cyclase class 2
LDALPSVAGAGVEVEAKVALPQGPGQVRDALRRLGAKPGPAAVEEDAFFAHPSRDLVAADEALRLRRTADGFELTHKGPRHGSGAVKARKETTVRTADDPTALLEELGFRRTVRLRKRRERHRLPGLEVTLDEVEGLGWFAEVEAVGSDRKAAEAAVEDGLRRLGLEKLPRLRESYVELALAAGASAAERE